MGALPYPIYTKRGHHQRGITESGQHNGYHVLAGGCYLGGIRGFGPRVKDSSQGATVRLL